MFCFICCKTDWNIITAIATVAISIISLFVSIRALRIQRKHNYHSLKPIAQVRFGDYENEIYVTICNTGVGPLIIDDLEVSNGKDVLPNIIEWIDFDPPEGLKWDTFIADFDQRAIMINEEIIILHISDLNRPPSKDHNLSYVEFKRNLRKRLAKLTVKIVYHHVYDNSFEYERSLSWFGRTLS